ncbi:hypothetical protein RF11_04579 [Thelohanellus kitauei]|uniref:Uncharacterized protein n=1 Tax=Thelohanellus kitauei TaxID=669202 RepID=A0A0C2J8V7_THEKT|nr:hypothetical protein RF11_04579 [Thelohanellus kitauei]
MTHLTGPPSEKEGHCPGTPKHRHPKHQHKSHEVSGHCHGDKHDHEHAEKLVHAKHFHPGSPNIVLKLTYVLADHPSLTAKSPKILCSCMKKIKCVKELHPHEKKIKKSRIMKLQDERSSSSSSSSDESDTSDHHAQMHFRRIKARRFLSPHPVREFGDCPSLKAKSMQHSQGKQQKATSPKPIRQAKGKQGKSTKEKEYTSDEERCKLPTAVGFEDYKSKERKPTRRSKRLSRGRGDTETETDS